VDCHSERQWRAGRSKETTKRSELAGWTDCGYYGRDFETRFLPACATSETAECRVTGGYDGHVSIVVDAVRLRLIQSLGGFIGMPSGQAMTTSRRILAAVRETVYGATLVLVAATGLFLAITTNGGPRPNHTPTADPWRELAERAIADFAALDEDQSAFSYAYLAAAIGRLYGWDDPRATVYLHKLQALQNPDGGYGLNYAWDAFSDGTVNPGTTTYTVTLAGHVGMPLLEGYRAGAVQPELVQQIVDLVVAAPRIDTTDGICLAYSYHANDAGAGNCVHNVNAGAAAFLREAQAAGFTIVDGDNLIAGITRREVAAYLPAERWWPYRDNPNDLQDTDHNSYSAESMYFLAPATGRQAAQHHMKHELADNPMAPIAHLRLTSLPYRPGGPNWCKLGERWLGEAREFASMGDRLPQVAYFAARNAEVC
jgi:hypothetical protein